MTGNILLPDTAIHFVATHTLSFRNKKCITQRNQHLQQMVRYLESIEGPVLAISDFNVAPWNPYVVRIRRQLNLLDSRQGFTPACPARWKIGDISTSELQCLDFHSIRYGGYRSQLASEGI